MAGGKRQKTRWLPALSVWMLRVPAARFAIHNMDEKHRSGTRDKFSRSMAFESADPQGSPRP